MNEVSFSDRVAKLRSAVSGTLPGASVAAVVAIAALAIAARYNAPAMLFALLLGMAMSFLHDDERLRAGIKWVGSVGLKLGVALMGLRVSFDMLFELGAGVFAVIVIGSATTILLGLLIGRALGWPGSRALIAAGAVAICGASAALALAAVTRAFGQKEEHTLAVIMSATALSTVAMIFYPVFLGMIGFSHVNEGIILGAAIHDVAQVIGAGFSVSEATGETATLAKMIRVALLPVLLLCVPTGGAGGLGRIRLPWFVVAFTLLMAVNQVIAVPPAISDLSRNVSGGLLIAAVAALGLSSAPRQLIRSSGKVFTMMMALSVWLLTCATVGVWALT